MILDEISWDVWWIKDTTYQGKEVMCDIKCHMALTPFTSWEAVLHCAIQFRAVIFSPIWCVSSLSVSHLLCRNWLHCIHLFFGLISSVLYECKFDSSLSHQWLITVRSWWLNGQPRLCWSITHNRMTLHRWVQNNLPQNWINTINYRWKTVDMDNSLPMLNQGRGWFVRGLNRLTIIYIHWTFPLEPWILDRLLAIHPKPSSRCMIVKYITSSFYPAVVIFHSLRHLHDTSHDTMLKYASDEK